MTEVNLEYLFISTTEEFLGSDGSNLLEVLIGEKIQDDTVTFFENEQNYLFTLISKRIGNHIYLKLTYICNRIKLQIIKDIEAIDLKIKILSKKNNFQRISLVDDLSKYYSNRLSKLFFQYEVQLRKLIYLIIPPALDNGKNWTETFDKELTNNIKEKNSGNYNKDSILEYLTLYDIEQYLFRSNYIDLTDSNENNKIIYKYREVNTEEFIKLLVDEDYIISSDRYSLWGKYFSSVVQINNETIEDDMKQLRDGRNIISHHKTISGKRFVHLKKLVKTYVKKLEELNFSIIENRVDETSMQIVQSDLDSIISNINHNLSDSNVLRLTNVAKNLLDINPIYSEIPEEFFTSITELTTTIKDIPTFTEETLSIIKGSMQIPSVFSNEALKEFNSSISNLVAATQTVPIIPNKDISPILNLININPMISKE